MPDAVADKMLHPGHREARLGCGLYIAGNGAKRLLTALEQRRGEVEAAIGPLEWDPLPGKQDARVQRYLPDMNVADRSCWGEAFIWLKREAEMFHNVFGPMVRSLPVIGSDPEPQTDISAD